MSTNVHTYYTLTLKEVDVIKLKSFQTLFHTREYVFATQSTLVHEPVLIRILLIGASDYIGTVLATNDKGDLQKLELLSYLVIRRNPPLSSQRSHHEGG